MKPEDAETLDELFGSLNLGARERQVLIVFAKGLLRVVHATEDMEVSEDFEDLAPQTQAMFCGLAFSFLRDFSAMLADITKADRDGG